MNPRDTVSGEPPEDGHWDGPAPAPIDGSGQHKNHWILPESERLKGFVRPVRLSYTHEKCGTVTTMPLKIAETYARQPVGFYGSTFCCHCRGYMPVGKDGEFLWLDGSKVGT